MVGNGVIVQLTERTFLGPHAAGEVPEVVYRERQIGKIGLTDGLAVVVGLDRGQKGQVFLHSVRDAIEHAGAFGYRGAPPFVCGRMRCVESKFNVFRLRTGDLADDLSGRG